MERQNNFNFIVALIEILTEITFLLSVAFNSLLNYEFNGWFGRCEPEAYEEVCVVGKN